MLEAAVEGLVDGVLKVLGPERAKLLIDNDWYLVESIFYGACSVPIDEYVKMQPEEVLQGERYRVGVARVALPILGWSRNIARMFPPKEIERKVTPEWLIARGERQYPELLKVWRDSGEKGDRWLAGQSRELVNFLTGRIVYDVAQRKMVALAPAQRRRP
jgi:hypothetical protein